MLTNLLSARFGPVKRISGLTLLVLLLFAAPASAGEARLWACHGPTGAPLGSDAFLRAQVFDVEFGGGCDLPGSALTAGFTRSDPNGQSEAKLIAPVPPGVVLSAVRLDRTARGPGYAVGALESESAGALLDGVATYPASGDSVALHVRCDAALNARCAGVGTAGFAVRALALTVQDATGPAFVVGGMRSPAGGVIDLDIGASDDGLGLRSAAAAIDGAQVALTSFGGCPELSPADATVDLALGHPCVRVGRVGLAVDTTAVAEGIHTLAVTVTDAAGNAVTQSQQFEVIELPTTTPTATATATATFTATATATATATPTTQPTASPTATPITFPAPVATATTTPTPPPAAKPTTAALVRLPKRVSRKGVYSVSVLCPAAAPLPCAHRLTLKAAGRTIATGRGTSKPGKRARIALRLTAAARATLRRQGAVTATLTLSGAAPTTVRLRA